MTTVYRQNYDVPFREPRSLMKVAFLVHSQKKQPKAECFSAHANTGKQ